MVGDTRDLAAITEELRDHIADFEDFCRPIRSYFYWEKHCYDIPICWSLRSIFDSIDGVDEISDKTAMVSSKTLLSWMYSCRRWSLSSRR